MIGGLLKSGSSVALFAALGLFTAGGVSPATAADLGGDCCADLEERVAELEATTARKGNRKVSLTISGQVSTMLMGWDDGNTSDVYVVDNVMSGGTFFALTGSANINPQLSAGFNVTIAMDTGGRSHQVSAADDDGTNGQGTLGTDGRNRGGFDTDIVMTLANWWLDHKQLGRVTVGRINTATAGISTIDLGGAGVIANASIGYTQRGFLDSGTGQSWNNLLGGATVNGASLSRANAISYTSPTISGFSVAAAWGENDMWDIALRYAGEFSGFRVAAGIGYNVNGSGLGDVSEERLANTFGFNVANGAVQNLTNQVSNGAGGAAEPTVVKGSASVLHVASGLYLTGAYLNQDNDVAGREDTRLWYVQGGISKNWTGLGNTVLYGEYANVDNGLDNFGSSVAVNSEATMWGIGIVQHIDAAAMEVFLAYKQFSADANVVVNEQLTSPEDFNVVLGGARIKF
jgi:hypothetical protein